MVNIKKENEPPFNVISVQFLIYGIDGLSIHLWSNLCTSPFFALRFRKNYKRKISEKSIQKCVISLFFFSTRNHYKWDGANCLMRTNNVKTHRYTFHARKSFTHATKKKKHPMWMNDFHVSHIDYSRLYSKQKKKKKKTFSKRPK